MVAPLRLLQTQHRARRPWLSALLIGLLLTPAAVRAQEPAAEQSAFITVGNPITNTEFSHVKKLTEEARRRYEEARQKGGDKAGKPLGRLKIVFDFNPDNQPAASQLFGPCLDLAAYLRSLNDVMTIAFVHKDVTRHTVLPVLACQEIVMAPAAPGESVRIGNVFPDDGDQPPRDADAFYADYRVRYYKEVAEQRGRSPAVVLKMLDRGLEVVKGNRADGSPVYVDRRRAKEQGAVTFAREPLLTAGSAAFFTGAQAKTPFELVQITTLASRREVKDWYDMPESSLREDVLEGRTPKAWRVVATGAFTRPMEETVKRRMSRAIGQGANFLILQLDCGGGDPIVAADLAEFIRTLKDNTGKQPVMTVAYLTEQSRDYALFPALACTEMVMDQKSQLGDFERILREPDPQPKGGQAPAPPNVQVLGDALAALAARRDYPPLLVRGMVDKDLAIFAVRSRANPSEKRYVIDPNEGDKWVVEGGGPLKDKGVLLVLNPVRANELGFSRHTVDNISQLYTLYPLDESRVRLAAPDWFEEFATFLRSSTVAFILVSLGITCLILELKLPGVGLPGIVAALCFILFFWAHAQLAFTWLAVLLFLMGLVLIAAEIFIVPGVTVLGISGVICVLVSLGLATMERWPQTEGDWVEAAGSVGRFGLAFIGAILAAIVAARYLPSIPYANRMVLVPPSERGEALADDAAGAEASPYAALLGAIGVAATTLRPSGMVRFGEDFVDVVAEGSYVDAGARVQVIEIEGNRIVVKEL